MCVLLAVKLVSGFIFFALDDFGRLSGFYTREVELYRAPDLEKREKKPTSKRISNQTVGRREEKAH